MAKKKYYSYLAFVIIIWGIAPVMVSYFYNYLSAAVYSAMSALISSVSFTLLARKNRKSLNKKTIKIAVITGVFYSLAVVLQMIGLQYTTPSMFAFLENTSCIVVPILTFFLLGKRPHPIVAFSCILCLVGCFILSGAGFSTPLGIGEILCSLAGIFYGVNMVGSGEYAKSIPVSLYLMLQKWIYTVVSVIVMLVLHFVSVDGKPLEPMVFRLRPDLLVLLIVYTFVSNTLCWLLRTKAIQNIDVTVVSVAMPLSSLITMVISVLLGTDVLSLHFVLGAAIILLATVLSGCGDMLSQRSASSL